jgi:tetratricopeptide (TPR) repeat protein
VAMNRASLLMRMGEVKQAEAAAAEAMRRSERLRGDAPATPTQAVAYGIILNRLGRHHESLELLTAARDQARDLGNELWGVTAKYHRARALMLAARFDEARAQLDEVRAAWSANTTANRDRLADLLRTQAELDLLQGRLAQARSSIDAALAQFGYPQDQSAPFLSAALTAAARIYARVEQPTQAERFATSALRISEQISRDIRHSADVGEALLVLASVKRMQGDAAAAAAYAERAIESLSSSLGQEHDLTRAALALYDESNEGRQRA